METPENEEEEDGEEVVMMWEDQFVCVSIYLNHLKDFQETTGR